MADERRPPTTPPGQGGRPPKAPELRRLPPAEGGAA